MPIEQSDAHKEGEEEKRRKERSPPSPNIVHQRMISI